MIKIYCDCCDKEVESDDFAFEATLSEVVISLLGKELMPQKQLKKRMIQICKECYFGKISKLLKNEKEVQEN